MRRTASTSFVRGAAVFRFSILAGLIVQGACARDPQALKTRSIEKAERFSQQGKLPEAIIEYRNAAQAVPHDGEVRLKLAEAYLKNREGTAAAREYIVAADLLAERVDVQLRAGNLLLLAGRFDDAQARADKILAAEPNNVDAHILAANALAGLRHFDAAMLEIEEAIRLSPNRGSAYASLGAVEVSRGRMRAAEAALTRAIEVDGDSAAAHLALASFYWSQSRWAETERSLQRALSIEPQNVSAHRALASLFVGLNRLPDAERHLKAAREISGSAEAALSLADFYLRRQDEPSARAVLEAMTASPGTDHRIAVRLAALDYAAGRREVAHGRVDGVLVADSSNLEGLVAKSEMLLSEGRVEEALLPAQAAVGSHPEAAPAHLAVARIEEARKRPDSAIAAYKAAVRVNPRLVGAHVALSRLHRSQGRSADAVASAENALTTDGTNSAARLALVRGLLDRGDLQRAESELKALVPQFPDSAAVRIQMGLLRARNKDLTGARKEFEHALKVSPSSPEALNALVALDLAANDPAAALARVRAHVPGDSAPPLLLVAARTHLATGDHATAEQLLRRSVEADPTFLPAYTALSQVYLRQGRTEAALQELETLTRRDPISVTGWTSAGIILQENGRLVEARERFERALQIDPSAPIAANNLAWIYAQSGENLDAARRLAETAYSRLPDSPEIGDTLGFICYKMDLLPRAIQLLTAAVEKSPSNPLFRYHLGLALAKSGESREARRHLTRAVELNPNFDGAADARNVIRTLDPR